MITIASTRFNQQTWDENCSYRERKNLNGCIYCSPLQLSSKIPFNSLVFILEMNNTHNKIEGIGVIKNCYQSQNRLVYNNRNYNRYIYKSKYRIDRSELYNFNPILVIGFEHVLFKEKTHLKRGSGITTVPDKLLKHRIFNEININIEIMSIFKKKFQDIQHEENIEIIN